MPNFWGCRCCGRRRRDACIFRVLDYSGNQLWTWEGYRLYQAFSFREDGWCLSPDNYLAHCGGNIVAGSLGLIDPDGVDVWNSPVGYESIEFYYPAIDSSQNLYVCAFDTLQVKVYSFDSTGSHRWTQTFTGSILSTGTRFGVRVGNGCVYLTWNPSSTSWKIVSMDFDGNILGDREYAWADGKSSDYGAFGVNLLGQAIFPWKNFGSSDGEADILDDTCSLVTSYPLSMDTSSGLAGTTFYGVGETSDGDIVLSGIERTSTLASRAVVWSAVDDALRFVPPFSSGTAATRLAANTSFDGSGAVCFVTRRSGPTEGRTITKCDESGAEVFRIQETELSDETYDPNSLYRSYQVACNGSRIVIASSDTRNVNGWTLT